MDRSDLDNRFDYHAPDESKQLNHGNVRRRLRRVADDLNVLLPESREKSIVMTKLEEAMFWANAAIARN